MKIPRIHSLATTPTFAPIGYFMEGVYGRVGFAVKPDAAGSSGAASGVLRDHRPMLIVLLIAAWAIVDVLLASHGHWLGGRLGFEAEITVRVVLLGCYLAQLSTLAGWLALGGGRVIVRGTASACGFILLHGLLWLFNGDHGNNIWLVVDSVFSVIVLGPLVAARAWGLRLHIAELPADSPRFQFSIANILYLTTATAIVLAIGKGLSWSIPGNDWVSFLLIVVDLAAIAWITWISMFRFRPRRGLLVTVAAALLLGFVAAVLEPGEPMPWMGLALAESLGLASNLLVLGVCGYKIGSSSNKPFSGDAAPTSEATRS